MAKHFLLVMLLFGSLNDAIAGTTSILHPRCVMLLHGLARTATSMNRLAAVLAEDGFLVANVDYPSREKKIEALSVDVIDEGVALCRKLGSTDVHVVTHSMGGILVRQYLQDQSPDVFARVVMLAPPNQGSEVVDALRDVPGFRWLNGPAGLQMGKDESSIPLQLGPVNVDVAVIAGTRSINPILSTYLPDPDDGKVSVASTRVDGMCAHLTLPVTHTFIMEDSTVIREVSHYLHTGRFISTRAEYPECAHRLEN